MSTPVISIRGVGKRYHLGDGAAHDTLRDHLSAGFRRLLRREKKERPVTEHWALRDVSFDVNEGEVVGIIGHNGAGKSTLLKILSQISEPTEGEIHVRGRIASLLEVGTGFHPELSGRENIFLNGAILGMTRAETRARFDDIVAFAEVEKFLDTPVKRYSSGMYVRLAFAVAAHLEPEILIVDEVLAVGDTAFQNRCLGKLDAVARAGRTVLFVSHNLAALGTLSRTGVWLHKGAIRQRGPIGELIADYLTSAAKSCTGFSTQQRSGSGQVRISNIRMEGGSAPDTAAFGRPFRIVIAYEAERVGLPFRFLIGIYDWAQQRVLALDNLSAGGLPETLPQSGVVSVEIPADFSLTSGRYTMNVAAEMHGENVDFIRNALTFHVDEGDFFGTGRLPYGKASVLVKHRWRLES